MKSWYKGLGFFAAICSVIASTACGSQPTCQELALCDPGTTSSSGAGSSGMTSGSGSSSGTMPNVEDCTNGTDDDNDGTIDCADSECSTMHTCLPTIPAGFTEVVTITVTAFGDPTGSCEGGVMPKLYYQSPAKDACDACTCDTSGVTCTAGTLSTAFDFNGVCNKSQPVQINVPDQCQQLFGSAAILDSGPMTSGTCTTGTSSGPPKPPMETTITTCSVGGTNGKGCESAGTCVANTGLANAEHTCIKKPGHEVCPGDWPLALYAFESFVDDRTGCTPCSCSAKCEGGTFTVYSDANCTTGAQPVDMVGQCISTGGVFGGGVKMAAPTATCTTTGGQMMGSVTPMNETTFCCY